MIDQGIALGREKRWTMDQVKASIRSNRWTIQLPIVISSASALFTTRFRTCCMIRLTGYSTGTNNVIRKSVDLPNCLCLLHDGNQINKHLVLWCSFTIENIITQDKIQ